MKSKDLQKIVHSKYQNGDTPTGAIGLRTIKRWCQTGIISPPSPRLVRTKANIKKVKNRLHQRSLER